MGHRTEAQSSHTSDALSPGRGAIIGALLGLTLLTPAPRAQAHDQGGPVLPADFEALPLQGTFNVLTDFCFAPDGSIYLVQKWGGVRRFDPTETQQSTPVLVILDEVNNNTDRGLLAIALHPGFVADGGPTSWMYLLYTVSPVPGQDLTFNQDDKYSFSRLTRYRLIETGGVVTADLASRHVLLGNQTPQGDVPDAIASVHMSHSNGTLSFADDGSLLVSVGDGAHFDLVDTGGFDDPAFDDWTHPVTGLTGPLPKLQDSGSFRSQDLRSMAGKLLRIDPETGGGYASNPFYTGDPLDNASRVWALGLRQPFRVALFPGTGATDPALGQPNVVAIGDVGGGRTEEIDISVTGGENFGWPCREGATNSAPFIAFDPADPDKVSCLTPTTGTLTDPALFWDHADDSDLFPPGVHMDEDGTPLGGFSGDCAISGSVYVGGSYPSRYDGRLFIADWVDNWIKTVELDAQWNVIAVRDFASSAESIVEIERHPITGDLYWAEWDADRIVHLRYTAGNATPVAVAVASPPIGPAPLVVSFTGSDSFDPDGDPITHDWDFGDASPHSSEINPTHTYAVEGVYTVTLSVTDDGSLTGFAQTPVFVGNAPVGVSIVSPAPGQTYDAPETIPLDGLALDPGGGPITYEWSADFYHDTHVHTEVFTTSGAQASLPLDTGPALPGELFYYRVQLKATNQVGISETAHVFVYPTEHVIDVTGSSPLITRVEQLVPPVPLGSGQPDPEVMRDTKRPAVGSSDPLTQWDSSHAGEQGADDWIGMELSVAPGEETRFVSLEFQEGMHFADGGWWEDMSVEVRDDGVWTPAANLRITPAYPFSSAGDPFFDGTSFQTYELHFDPTFGDAVRLRGTPGGTTGYVSAGELRALLIRKTPPPSSYADITSAGVIIAKLFELSPPVPQGLGNPDPETIRNGTLPEVGSESAFAQFDTAHGGEQGDQDWIGYEFDDTRSLVRMDYQEGVHLPDGGGFDSIDVHVQIEAGGPWLPVPEVSLTPSYTPGLAGAGYESFSFSFPPVLARAIRLVGNPAGSGSYVSVGELRVYEPALASGCGWEPYGTGHGGANSLQLSSPTPAALGLPTTLQIAGALPTSFGFLGVAFDPAAAPLKGGTLLLDPGSLQLTPLQFAADGNWSVATTLPAQPAAVGAQVWLQAYAYGQPAPWPVRFSNGLKLTLCNW